MGNSQAAMDYGPVDEKGGYGCQFLRIDADLYRGALCRMPTEALDFRGKGESIFLV